MSFTKFLLYFLIIFFLLQLFFGEAGLVAFIQEKSMTKKFYENVSNLIDINLNLDKQVALTENNESYVLMNSHRVGLLADDEYLIKTDYPLSSNSVVYSPGTVLLGEKLFYLSNIILFFISISIMCGVILITIFKKRMFCYEKKLLIASLTR